jgi:thioredoxin
VSTEAAEASAGVRSLGGDNWEAEVLGSPVPVLVGFWAQWCVPCRTLFMGLEEAARRFGRSLRVGRLDVEHDPAVAARYAIQGLPTLLLLRGETTLERRVGVMARDDLVRLLEPHVGRGRPR